MVEVDKDMLTMYCISLVRKRVLEEIEPRRLFIKRFRLVELVQFLSQPRVTSSKIPSRKFDQRTELVTRGILARSQLPAPDLGLGPSVFIRRTCAVAEPLLS